MLPFVGGGIGGGRWFGRGQKPVGRALAVCFYMAQTDGFRLLATDVDGVGFFQEDGGLQQVGGEGGGDNTAVFGEPGEAESGALAVSAAAEPCLLLVGPIQVVPGEEVDE